MNIEYMKLGDRVYVTDDEGHTFIKNNNENIEEILIKENRLELLNNLIEKKEKELKEITVILYSNKSYFKIANLLFILIIVDIPLLIDVVTMTASFSLIYLIKLLLPVILGELLMIPMVKIANSNLVKKQKCLQALLEKANLEKNKLKKELKEYKLQIRKNLIKDWDLDFLIEKVKTVETKEISDDKCIVINEYPYFVDLDEEDNNYLEQINEMLDSVYNEAEEKYLESLKNKKRKVLKK